MPTEYGSNSHKSRAQQKPEEKEKIEKVVTGEVVQKKRSFGQKFKAIFFGGEFRSSSKYVAGEVLLPTLRNMLVDATTRGMERMVYGESSARRRIGGPGPSYGSRIQYNNPTLRRDRPYLPDQVLNRTMRQVRRDTNDLVLASREEAETVLERLLDILSKYEVVSLADLYDLCGLPTSPIDNKWGWTYLNNTEIRQVRDGYLLDLPPTEEI